MTQNYGRLIPPDQDEFKGLRRTMWALSVVWWLVLAGLLVWIFGVWIGF